MATEVDIVNAALSHLGAKANVASINPPDGSAEAYSASRFFTSAVYDSLARVDWSFARKRAALNAVELPAGEVSWRYAYAKPSDCLAPRRILSGATTQYGDDSAAFEIEGETVLTNKDSAVLVYTQPITDASKFPVLFQKTVAADLAAYLAGPILRGTEGVNAAVKLRQLAQMLADQAAAADGNSSSRPPEGAYTPASLAARGHATPVTESTMIYRG